MTNPCHRRKLKSALPRTLATRLRSASERLIDRLSVRMGRGHTKSPRLFGRGPHDCALTSLYWAAPQLSEERIAEAIQYCTVNWPFAGITNSEFAVALSYLGVQNSYRGKTETLGQLLDRTPAKCVALLPFHFIAIIGGRIVGADSSISWNPTTTVYCSWTVHR